MKTTLTARECLSKFTPEIQKQITENISKQCLSTDDNYCDEIEFIHGAFSWADTQQGYAYWETIADGL